MAWSTPKTNWASGEFFTYADYNRITENIEYLYAYCNTNIGYIGTPYDFPMGGLSSLTFTFFSPFWTMNFHMKIVHYLNYQ